MDSKLLVTHWKTWRTLLTTAEEDTYLTNLKASNRPTSAAQDNGPLLLVPQDYDLAVRIWGKGAENDTASIRFIGWMDNGPGQILWDGSITLGAETIDETPLADPDRWGSAATWYEVDTYTATSNGAGALLLGVADDQHVFLLPTLGYKYVTIEIKDKDGTGTEADGIGVAYRAMATHYMAQLITNNKA